MSTVNPGIMGILIEGTHVYRKISFWGPAAPIFIKVYQSGVDMNRMVHDLIRLG